MRKTAGIHFDINYDTLWYSERAEIRVRVKRLRRGLVAGIWNYKLHRFFISKLWPITSNPSSAITPFSVDERYTFDLIYFRYVRWCDFLTAEGYNLGIRRPKSWQWTMNWVMVQNRCLPHVTNQKLHTNDEILQCNIQ